MIRCMIVCEDPIDLLEIFMALNDFKNIDIVKVKNNLNKPIQNVNMNLIFLNKIVAECQLKCG